MHTTFLEALHRAFVAFGRMQAWRAAGLLVVMHLAIILGIFYTYTSWYPKEMRDVMRENIALEAARKDAENKLAQAVKANKTLIEELGRLRKDVNPEMHAQVEAKTCPTVWGRNWTTGECIANHPVRRDPNKDRDIYATYSIICNIDDMVCAEKGKSATCAAGLNRKSYSVFSVVSNTREIHFYCD